MSFGTLGNGVPFTRESGYSRLGSFLHTGGVTGSIPVVPTNLFNDLSCQNGVPAGSREPTGLRRGCPIPLSKRRMIE